MSSKESFRKDFCQVPFFWSKDKAMQMYKEILAAQAAVQQKEHVSEWDVKFLKKRGVEVEEVHGTVFVSIYGSIVWDPLFPTLPYRKWRWDLCFLVTRTSVFEMLMIMLKHRQIWGRFFLLLSYGHRKPRLHGTPKSKMRWKLPPKRFGIWDTCLRRKRLKQLDGSFIIYETLFPNGLSMSTGANLLFTNSIVCCPVLGNSHIHALKPIANSQIFYPK